MIHIFHRERESKFKMNNAHFDEKTKPVSNIKTTWPSTRFITEIYMILVIINKHTNIKLNKKDLLQSLSF